MNTIVLALDGSDGSRRAIPVAVSQAKRSDARIVIAHVEERIAAKGDMPTVRADEDEIVKRIEGEAAEISEAGVDATVERATVVLGGPAQAIAEIADESDAEMIVVGTRGHSPIPGLLIGSVATRLLHIAKRPVLAVPPSA